MGAEGSKRQLPDKAMIGMVHVGALPGTPKNTLPLSKIIEKVFLSSA
jgi:predicted TIM-barrel enzyme